MKIKKEKLKWIPSILVAMVISFGATMKLAAAPQLVEIYSKIGLLPYMKLLGASELLLTGLFLVPSFDENWFALPYWIFRRCYGC